MELLNKTELPDGFVYPEAFLRLIEQNLIDLSPWIIDSGNSLKLRHSGLKKRFPNHTIIPFARRLDNDDIACWLEGDNQTVFVIHDFATNALERKKKFISFWAWFKTAIDDMIDYDN
jgi:hypothetical protein